MMKKTFLVTLLLLFIVGIANTQELKTITYTINGKTKTVKAQFTGWQKTRSYLEGKYRDTWLIVERAFKPLNGDWGNYERINEMPVPNITNSQLEAIDTATLNNTKYAEFEDNGNVFILIRIPNDYNQMSWWEERKYLYYVQELYIIR